MKKVLPYMLLLLIGASCTTYQEIGNGGTLERPLNQKINYTIPTGPETDKGPEMKTQNRESVDRIEVLSFSVAVANR